MVEAAMTFEEAMMQYFTPEWALIYLALAAAMGVVLLVITMLSGDVTWCWIKAWWNKSPIMIEWTRNRRWRFHVPSIDKAIPEMWEVDKQGRAFQSRREAIGTGPHNVQLGTATSEFPTLVSLEEATGSRYFSSDNFFWGIRGDDNKVYRLDEPTKVEIERQSELTASFKDEKFMETDEEQKNQLLGELQMLTSKIVGWEEKKMWVKYPSHLTTMDEFVKFQKVNPDPKLQAAYGRRKELLAKMNMNNLFQGVQANLHYLVPFVMVCGIIMYWLDMNNTALQAQQATIACKETMTKVVAGCGDHAREILGNVTLKSGGKVT